MSLSSTTSLPQGWDPYDELGVERSAALDQIKSSFRKLARLHHPDKAGKTRASEEKGGSRDFILVRLAYEILSDPERRRAVDAGGSALSDSMAVGAVAEVDLDDMEYDEARQIFACSCRCSGRYEITTEQLDDGFNTICCSSCSLCISVMYEIDEEEEEGQGRGKGQGGKE